MRVAESRLRHGRYIFSSPVKLYVKLAHSRQAYEHVSPIAIFVVIVIFVGVEVEARREVLGIGCARVSIESDL